MRIVIIEDEKLTARDLARTIKAIEPDAEILPILTSVEEALAFLEQKPAIDLIFSDIELGDGLSFTIFQRVQNDVPVIFCTAYEQYPLEAFQHAGIDYVLKPFSPASIEKTLLKYKSLKEKLGKPAGNYDVLATTLPGKFAPAMPSVIVYQGDKIIPVSGHDIALFYTQAGASFVCTFAQKKYLVEQTLDALEKLFGTTFFRANRQFLINRKAVKDASQHFNRKLVANLTVAAPEPVVVSKLKTARFIQWLAEH